jgi:hypothetical protein
MVCLLIVVTFVVSLLTDGLYLTNYAAYDWYEEGNVRDYSFLNFTIVHIFEVVVLSVCIYVHR